MSVPVPRHRSAAARRLLGCLLAGTLSVGLAAGDQAATPAPAARPYHPDVPYQTPTSLGAAAYAKVLCSAIFVSGRTAEEAQMNSAYFLMPVQDRQTIVRANIDRGPINRVTVTVRGVARVAQLYGDQGCIIHPEGRDGIFFTPVPVRTSLPDASTQPWPMGDAPSTASWPAGLDKARLQSAIDLAFADPEGQTAAMVVVHKGQIVGERYMPGVTKDTQLESWSMGKSLTAALVGLMVRDGAFALDDPAPVPEWRRPGDPRGAITVRHLLQMSSGLRFTGQDDKHLDPETEYHDHFFIYAGAVDAFRYSISSPVEHPAGTVGRYRNSDPLTLGYLVQQEVRRRGEEYLTYPQRALFDRIGIRRQVLETDPYGNFLLTGYDYGTARNWARLGLLYLNDGVWQGERLLPEGWASFVSTPAPAWEEPEYGGLFWLNRTKRWNLPEDAYVMSGAGGQHVFVVPSLDLVVVRMGHQRGAPIGTKLLNQSLEAISAAVRGG